MRNNSLQKIIATAPHITRRAQWRGKCDVVPYVDEIDRKEIHILSPDAVTVQFDIPLYAVGDIPASLIDFSAQIFWEKRASRATNIRTTVLNVNKPRSDGYWVATPIQPWRSPFWVRVQATLDFPGAVAYLREHSFLTVELEWTHFGNRPLQNSHKVFTLPLKDFTRIYQLRKKETPPPLDPPRHASPAAHVIPIRTEILKEGDDLVEVVLRATGGIAAPGDMLCLAESPVAITQGRYKHVAEIRPGFFARILCRLFDLNASLSSPFSMQMAIEEVGLSQIILATILGIGGKLLGKSGVFYKIAGRGVTAIDDCCGTIAPYDKCVVLGPEKAEHVVTQIKARTGMDCCIVDSNDLHHVDIFATTDPSQNEAVLNALWSNPHGNGDEQTPIVVIREIARRAMAMEGASALPHNGNSA